MNSHDKYKADCCVGQSYHSLTNGYSEGGVLPHGYVHRQSAYGYTDPRDLLNDAKHHLYKLHKAVRKANALRKIADHANSEHKKAVQAEQYLHRQGIPSYGGMHNYNEDGVIPYHQSQYMHSDPSMLTGDLVENFGFSSIVHSISSAASSAAAAAKRAAKAAADRAAAAAHAAEAKAAAIAKEAKEKAEAAAKAAAHAASSAGHFIAKEASAVANEVEKAAHAMKGAAQKFYCDNVHVLCDKALAQVEGKVGAAMCEPMAAEMAGVCEMVGATVPPPLGEIMGTACAASAGDLVLKGCNDAIEKIGSFAGPDCTKVLKKPFCPPETFHYRPTW
jgi:hypothetical protein